MAIGRVIVAVACLAMAGAAHAAGSPSVRLPFNIRALDAAEISYHPSRWLTLRRSVALVRPDPVADVATASTPASARSHAYALTADIHPFANGFRLSVGLREDANRRLLRSGNDRADIPTAQYAPAISFGYAEEVGDGFSLGGDFGVLGGHMFATPAGVLVTPVEMASRPRNEDRGLTPVLRLSADYRF